MTSMPLTTLPIEKIVVLRALKLGDFLAATPALRALKASFADARLDYIGLPWMKELVPRYAYISDLIVFPGWPGLPEQPFDPAATIGFLRTLRARRYDLALQMHGDGTMVNFLVPHFGASITAGFACGTSYWPNVERFMAYPGDRPEILRLLDLLAFLGIPTQGTQLDFPLQSADYAALSALIEAHRLAPPYAVIHPGAASSQPWPAEHFAAVADACMRRGLAVALTGSPQEAPLTARVARHMRGTPADLAGQTPLGVLGALIKHSAAFIGNDTGVAHIAVALGTPSVTIFTTSEPGRWAPLNQTLHRVVLPDTAAPEAVLRHVSALLEGAA